MQPGAYPSRIIKQIGPFVAALILAHYVYYFLRNCIYNSMFIHLFSDYRVWWAVSHLIMQGRFSSIYDLPALYPLENQLNVFPHHFPQWVVLPMVYLGVFALPLAPLAMLKPMTGLIVFTLFNMVVFFGYLYYFCRREEINKPFLSAATTALANPVYLNFFFAQVSSYLVIPFGQFLRNGLRTDKFRAGLWLSVALLKPQMLIIFAPGLIIARQWRVLFGLVVGSAAIIVGSFSLVGLHGFMSEIAVVSDYHLAYGSFPDGMISWRMIPSMVCLAGGQLWNCQPWWNFWCMIMGITYIAGLLLWIYPGWSDLPVTLLGTMAATILCGWHAHPHMAVALLPPLLFLLKRPNASWLFTTWVYVPAVEYVLALTFIDWRAAWINALTLLAGNVFLLAWSLWTTHSARMEHLRDLLHRFKERKFVGSKINI